MRRGGLGSIGVLAIICIIFGCVPVRAAALSNNRKYEMVSPLYKGGFGALHIEAVAPNGGSVLFYSPGAFAGAPSGPEVGFDYIAHRGSSDWSTTALIVPASVMPYIDDKDVSPTLDSVLALGKPGANQEEAFQISTEEEFRLHLTDSLDTAASWELAGMVMKAIPEKAIVLRYVGASPDFCHILVAPAEKGTDALLPEATGATGSPIYEVDRGCDGEPALRLLGLNNRNEIISPTCGPSIGIDGNSGSTAQSQFNAIAADGKEIFFTTCTEGLSSPRQLFVRLDSSKTLEISKPVEEACSEVPCPGASKRARSDFVGASEDGSTVFFTTVASIEPNTDPDAANDLYMAKIGCPENESECEISERVVKGMVQVSHDPHAGQAAEVQGAVRLAPDGKRVYFVAHGDLISDSQRLALEAEGRPVAHAGADNLYVYDGDSHEIKFIGDLCSGKELTGTVEDLGCPTSVGTDAPLWSEEGTGEEQTAGADARFLVFATYAQLLASDTDRAKDIYRYDAVTGSLTRVSTGEHGYHSNGNDNAFSASIAPGHWGGRRLQFQYEMDNRAVSEDGSRIIFTSVEPLSPAAANGLANVYEWSLQAGEAEGGVSLISSGDAEEPVEDAVISPEGNDVFFITTQGLILQDTDGAPDVYDARVHGGFALAPAQREPCASDACQGPLTNPAPLLVPASAYQAPGENLSPPKAKVSPKKKKKSKKKKKPKVKAKRAKQRRSAGKVRRALRSQHNVVAQSGRQRP